MHTVVRLFFNSRSRGESGFSVKYSSSTVLTSFRSLWTAPASFLLRRFSFLTAEDSFKFATEEDISNAEITGWHKIAGTMPSSENVKVLQYIITLMSRAVEFAAVCKKLTVTRQ
jgi:hypothetical protein